MRAVPLEVDEVGELVEVDSWSRSSRRVPFVAQHARGAAASALTAANSAVSGETIRSNPRSAARPA